MIPANTIILLRPDATYVLPGFGHVTPGYGPWKDVEAYLASLTPEERAKVLIDEPKPPEPTSEQKAAAIRSQRNALLTASDWAMLSDAPFATSQKAAYSVYRQALRDITDQLTFPDSVVWPVKPE